MEEKEFKKIISNFLQKKGFSKKGRYHICEYEDLIVIIGFQKSQFAEGFYINVGYLLRPINQNIDNPRDIDGDIRTRFSFVQNNKTVDFFELSSNNDSDEVNLEAMLEKNHMQLFERVKSLEGIKELLKEQPLLLYQTTKSAKDLLRMS